MKKFAENTFIGFAVVTLEVKNAFNRRRLSTTYSEAACVIAGILPMDIMASEARHLYEKRSINLPEKGTEYRKETRRESLEKWQLR